MLSSFRAAALSAHLRPQPHSRPAAGTTNNLWWAVVDFLAELPQAGFPCSGEVLKADNTLWKPMVANGSLRGG